METAERTDSETTVHSQRDDQRSTGGRTGPTSTDRREFLKLAGAAGLAGAVGTGALTGTAAAQEVQRGGTLVIGQQSDVGQLDPHRTNDAPTLRVLSNVYQTLTFADGDFQPVGLLASEWETAEDGTTWTFTLREGVQFHAPVSREMTAEDVAFSIERILSEETGSPWASDFEPVESVTAEDDTTVVFQLSEPFAPFLVKLRRGFVVPREAADEVDLSTQPVGTGPFAFEETVAQTRTTLTAVDGYWETDDAGEPLPYLDGLEFRPIPEGQARVTALQTGEIDYVTEVPQAQAASLEAVDGITFSRLSGTFYDYIGQNTESPPLDDVQLRQAISSAVDREAIAQGARFGFAVPTQDPISPASAFDPLITVDDPYTQDFDVASQLVEESTYAGETLTIKVGQEFEEQVSTAEIVQAQLQEAGINAALQPTEFSTLLSDLNSGEFQLTVLGWATLTDPDDLMFLQFHTGEDFNQTNYSNEEVDRLLEAGRSATGSMEERAAFYDDAIDIIAEEAPYTFLVYNDEIDAWVEAVQDANHIATGIPRFTRTWKQS